ncbi:hypothetical protein ANANG_G00015060 [Anguilla anguilla]|uniref:Centrosomal protein 192 n=1 Tax=Anguilla anguilla TaxID=7936 RepID=A0A9D3N1I7_ANGAN|nr:hypothetical protein ANANG_G00015060 [Anguilla anguilla]
MGRCRPRAPGGPADRRGCETLSPQSHCSSPSLSRLTYISLNDSTVLPSPDRGKVSAAGNSSIALSTTIVRSSPTPLTEQELPQSRPNAPLGQPLGLDPRPSRGQSPDGRPEAGARGPATPRTRTPGRPPAPPGARPAPPRPGIPATPATSTSCSRAPPASRAPSLWAGAPDKREPRQVAGSGCPLLPRGGPALLPGRRVPCTPTPSPRATHTARAPPFPTPTPSGLALQHGSSAPPSCTGPTCPLEPGLLGPGKPYGPLGALGVWSTAGLADLSAQVVVPDELRFPGSCCVGIASQTSLSIFNPTERWLQVGIAVSGLAIDGEKVDSLPYQWLMVKNKTIIGPKSTEEQKVLLVPPRAGVYQCTLSVSSWPTAAEAEAAARAQVFAKRVVLVAMAENPSLEVDAGAAGCLDFGDLAGGSARALPLKLVNRTRATVPVRLVISANATAWRCFTFSKSPVAVPTEAMLQTGSVAPLAAPSVMNHVMHANYGDNPESFMLWVHFHAPQKYASASGALGPADEYSARVDIEVDSPGPSQVIRSVQLRARSGTARVHAPKDMQVVHLVTMLGKSTSQTLPLKNAGNIDVQLKLRSSGADDCFSVTPEELLLRAGEERGVTVSFAATGARKCRESMLTILVLPSGPQYEVVLKGEVAPDESPRRPLPGRAAHADAPPPGEVPPILSNKQFMAWGGVTLGRAVQQKLVLRNNSPSSTQQLRLLIRGQDQDCFQLQSTFGPEERLTRHRELSIRPKEDVAVHLLFAPTRVACMLAKLEIKQSAVRPSQPGVKFTIPLSGYGGTSNIILEEVKKLSDSYVVTLGGVAAGRVSKACLSMRNTGSRARLRQGRRLLRRAGPHARRPRPHQPGARTVRPQGEDPGGHHGDGEGHPREQELCQSGAAPLATVCFFCGDEVSRQQYRRFVHSNPDAGRKVLSDNSLLKNVNFHRSFLGEEQVTEAYDLPLRPNEAHLFYGGMSKVVLSVLGSAEGSDSGESDGMETLRPSARRGSESDSGFGNSDRHVSNVSLDVLPHGVIEPESDLQILISPNPSLATKLSLLPWSGQIYVQCDGQQKFIKVQIRQDLALDVSATASLAKPLSSLPPQAETPPAPASGETSESVLEVENKGEEVRWYLSSFAPPYVKGVDSSGDVYRATYTAFRCSRVSGTLGVQEKMQIPITFLPRDRGDYAQFWDLECHPLAEPQHKSRIRFQLCGTGVKAGAPAPPQERDCSLVRTEATVKARKRPEAPAVKTSQEEAPRRGVYAPQDLYTFPQVRAGESSTLKVNVRNNSFDTHELKFVSPREPFFIKHSKYSLRSQHYINIPVQFKPGAAGKFSSSLLIQADTSASLSIRLTGEALP